MIKEIPLVAAAQTLTTVINGTTYNLVIYFRGVEYVLDLYDNLNQPIIQGIALVTGVDLLKSYKYLNLGFGMFISTDIDKTSNPFYDTLGISNHLLVFN